jgi:hypothetical protein
MIKKIIAAAVTVLLSSSFCLAETAAPTNKHREMAQRARECKKLAADQNLTGEDARNYVITCMKG